MTDDPCRLGAIDPEEERAASALRRALDGGPAEPDLHMAEIETAALLRYSADAGRLCPESRARLREQLLSSLPRSAAPRAGVRVWLGLGLPLVGAATLIAMLWLASAREGSREAVGSAPHAARSALPEADSPAIGQLARAARQYRAELVSALKSPELEQAHALGDRALLDPAASRAELEHAERVLRGAAAAPAEGHWSASDARRVRQDLFCRLAEAALRLGQPDAALDWTRRGLALDGPPSPFLAQLSALEGQARQALGDRVGAARSYMQALEVNEALLDESLEGAP